MEREKFPRIWRAATDVDNESRRGMGAKGAGNKAESAYEQDQHDESVEETSGAKIDVHVGEDARQYEEGTGDGEKPPRRATTVPEEKPYDEKHGNQSESKGVRAEKAPKGTGNTDLVGQEVPPEAGHDYAGHEMAEAAWCAANIVERTICHGPEHSRLPPRSP